MGERTHTLPLASVRTFRYSPVMAEPTTQSAAKQRRAIALQRRSGVLLKASNANRAMGDVAGASRLKKQAHSLVRESLR